MAGGELRRADGDGRAGAGSLAAVAQIGGGEGETAIGIEKDRQVGGAAARAAAAGSVAEASLEVRLTVSLTVLTRFHWASTALTVTGKLVPDNLGARRAGLAARQLPGAALSPGTSNCNFVKGGVVATMLAVVLAEVLAE